MGWRMADGWSKKQDGSRSALGGKAARMGVMEPCVSFSVILFSLSLFFFLGFHGLVSFVFLFSIFFGFFFFFLSSKVSNGRGSPTRARSGNGGRELKRGGLSDNCQRRGRRPAASENRWKSRKNVPRKIESRDGMHRTSKGRTTKKSPIILVVNRPPGDTNDRK
ncbi:hypothetical protein BO78DRAFT_195739 [Aspergillus sclerotiicarbonarius CBS 121057]|uniref:Uncharacterized protein n=1 Tax=Aspergillus sclerotiicarbonarius (strain CBS 121057 / IBT 28362) TaxID=1448318 RepID=A0A319EID6_ASPSB|nr:hypothetical protein BO78DRAFT_195739 [Aspergillus sclerotiicarbonarius CBS 121057]